LFVGAHLQYCDVIHDGNGENVDVREASYRIARMLSVEERCILESDFLSKIEHRTSKVGSSGSVHLVPLPPRAGTHVAAPHFDACVGVHVSKSGGGVPMPGGVAHAGRSPFVGTTHTVAPHFCCSRIVHTSNVGSSGSVQTTSVPALSVWRHSADPHLAFSVVT
jgi:hypothetical protein